MSDTSSRVLSFIQRAKLLTESSKSIQEAPVRQQTPVIKPDSKPQPSKFIFPSSRDPPVRQPSPKEKPESAKEHKSSNSQIFFPSTMSDLQTAKPSISHKPSSSQSNISLKKLPISQQSKPSSKPPTPKTSNIRSSTPKSNSPALPFSKSPKNSEIMTKPPSDLSDMEGSIEYLQKIRAEIEEKIKQQQMEELKIIQIIGRKLEKVKKAKEKYENIEKAQTGYKEKFERFVNRNKAKASEFEKKLEEAENENKKLKGVVGKRNEYWAWLGRTEQSLDVKVKNEEELEEVTDEQIAYFFSELEKNGSEEDNRKLLIALGKKVVIEQNRLSRMELVALNMKKEEESMIEFLEKKIKNDEELDVV